MPTPKLQPLPNSSHKYLFISLVIILFLLVVGCAEPVSNQIVITQPKNTNQKVCGNFPNDYKDENYLLGMQPLSKVDSSTTANSMLIYPGAIKITQLGVGTGTELVLACAQSADVATVIQYYSKMSGYQTISAPSPFLNANTKLGSFQAVGAADNTKGVVYFYDVGSGDILLLYSPH